MIIEFVFMLIGLLFLFHFILGWLGKMKRRKLLKNYNEKNDKSREGRRILDEGNGKASTRKPNFADLDIIKGGGQLPISSIVSVGKNSKSPRGFFRRRKRR